MYSPSVARNPADCIIRDRKNNADGDSEYAAKIFWPENFLGYGEFRASARLHNSGPKTASGFGSEYAVASCRDTGCNSALVVAHYSGAAKSLSGF